MCGLERLVDVAGELVRHIDFIVNQGFNIHAARSAHLLMHPKTPGSVLIRRTFSANLCVLCASAVNLSVKAITAEAQRTQRFRRDDLGHRQTA